MFREDLSRRSRRHGGKKINHGGHGVNYNFFITSFSYVENHDVIRKYLKLQLRAFVPPCEIFSGILKRQVEYGWRD